MSAKQCIMIMDRWDKETAGRACEAIKPALNGCQAKAVIFDQELERGVSDIILSELIDSINKGDNIEPIISGLEDRLGQPSDAQMRYLIELAKGLGPDAVALIRSLINDSKGLGAFARKRHKIKTASVIARLLKVQVEKTDNIEDSGRDHNIERILEFLHSQEEEIIIAIANYEVIQSLVGYCRTNSFGYNGSYIENVPSSNEIAYGGVFMVDFEKQTAEKIN